MTAPTQPLPAITPPAATPEQARAMMQETAAVLTAETGVVISVAGGQFVLGNVPMTIDQIISTLCREQPR